MKTIYSLSDLPRVFKLRPRKDKVSEEIRKCRKCGGIMHLVDGTNIFVCGGNNGKGCSNRAVKRVNGFNGEGSACYTPKKTKLYRSDES